MTIRIDNSPTSSTAGKVTSQGSSCFSALPGKTECQFSATRPFAFTELDGSDYGWKLAGFSVPRKSN